MKVLVIFDHIDTTHVVESVISHLKQSEEAYETEYEIHDIRKEADFMCRSCGKCKKRRRCITDDLINQLMDHADTYDGIITFTHAYYGEASREMINFLNRLQRTGNDRFAYLPYSNFMLARKNGIETTDEIRNLTHLCAWMHIEGRLGSCVQNEEDILKVDDVMRQMCWVTSSIQKAGLAKPQCTMDKIIDYTR